MGRGGAGVGGRCMALGRGLAMHGLGPIPESVLSDCFGEICEMLFGEVDVAEEPEPCLCMAAVPWWPATHCCWGGGGMGETGFG